MNLVILACLVAAAYAAPASDVVDILKYANDANPDGTYQWSYEASNGIHAEESGSVTGSHGSYHFKTPDGVDVSITYTADENGFQAQGNSLPIGPPIPEAILRSLAWNEAHPEKDQPRGKL